MTDDMLHVMKWHNGDKSFSPFSDAEMARRQNDVRGWMAKNNVDAALFTSYHCINYYSGWLYCYFGRKYGMVIDHDNATTISDGIDGGQPWRRSYGDNVTYTDWRRDNFYQAVRQLTPGAKRIGIEFDHVSLDFRRQLEAALPGVEFIDVGQPSMWMRTVKSAEEHKLIREGARVCSLGLRPKQAGLFPVTGHALAAQVIEMGAERRGARGMADDTRLDHRPARACSDEAVRLDAGALTLSETGAVARDDAARSRHATTRLLRRRQRLCNERFRALRTRGADAASADPKLALIGHGAVPQCAKDLSDTKV